MRTLEEINNTPGGLLTDEELALTDPSFQAGVRRLKAQRACPGHEPEDQGSYDDHRRGWHPAKCKHCGMDMSVDSGD